MIATLTRALGENRLEFGKFTFTSKVKKPTS